MGLYKFDDDDVGSFEIHVLYVSRTENCHLVICSTSLPEN